MAKRILITGASGLLGRSVLRQLKLAQYDITIGGRNQHQDFSDFKFQHYDLVNKNGTLNLKEIDILIHLASTTKDLNSKADITGMKQLIEIGKRDQIKRIILISIVGVDKVPLPYFKTKKKVEAILINSGLAYNILRSTQFLAFFEAEIKKQLQKKVIIIPNICYQPIEVDLVANKIKELCTLKTKNVIEEIGGREILSFKAGIQAYLHQFKHKKWIFSIPTVLLGKFGKSLTTKNIAKGSKTWKEYLKNKT